MLYAVANEAYKLGVDIRDRKEAISIIHQDGRCYGAVVRDLITGELTAYVAKGTLIATGGYGRVYRNTTNAVICEGTGAALAMETGVVKLGNMEAVQFHPTPIVPSGILLTEGCRGDGGVLRDVDGYRFMPDYEPEKKELASRDVVSRRMLEHIRKGKGVKSPYEITYGLIFQFSDALMWKETCEMFKIFVKHLQVLTQRLRVYGHLCDQCNTILWGNPH